MALSTLRSIGKRPLWSALLQYNSVITNSAAPMASTAHEEMKQFWAKNQKLNRPSSPWIIYMPHLPMLTSLTHRVTGIGMGVVLYIISTDLFLAPGDFPSYIEMIKNWNISPMIMFPAKMILAFPLVYHYINGIRHLTWDAGKGFEMKTQYRSGWAIVSSAIIISATLAGYSYLK